MFINNYRLDSKYSLSVFNDNKTEVVDSRELIKSLWISLSEGYDQLPDGEKQWRLETFKKRIQVPLEQLQWTDFLFKTHNEVSFARDLHPDETLARIAIQKYAYNCATGHKNANLTENEIQLFLEYAKLSVENVNYELLLNATNAFSLPCIRSIQSLDCTEQLEKILIQAYIAHFQQNIDRVFDSLCNLPTHLEVKNFLFSALANEIFNINIPMEDRALTWLEHNGHQFTFKDFGKFLELFTFPTYFKKLKENDLLRKTFFKAICNGYEACSIEDKRSRANKLNTILTEDNLSEHILEYLFELGSEYSKIVRNMYELTNNFFFISLRVERGLLEEIRFRDLDIKACSQLLIISDILMVIEYRNRSQTFEECVIKLFEENSKVLESFVSTIQFKNSLLRLKTNRNDLMFSQELTCFLQRQLTSGLEANAHTIVEDKKVQNEVFNVAAEKLSVFSRNSHFVCPPLSLKPIDFIEFEGCCFSLCLKIAQKILPLFPHFFEPLFNKQVNRLTLKYHKGVSHKVFIDQIAYATLLRQEVFWNSILTNLYFSYELNTPLTRAVAMFLFCLGQGISKDKIINLKLVDRDVFFKLNGEQNEKISSQRKRIDKQEISLITSFFKADFKNYAEAAVKNLSSTGHLDLINFRHFLDKVGVGSKIEQNSILLEVEKFTSVCLLKVQKHPVPNRELLSQSLKVLRNVPLFTSLQKLNLLSIDNFKLNAEEKQYSSSQKDYNRYLAWVKEGTEGVYLLMISKNIGNHAILLARKDERVIIMDPNCLRIDETTISWSLKDPEAFCKDFERSITSMYPYPIGNDNHDVNFIKLTERNEFHNSISYLDDEIFETFNRIEQKQKQGNEQSIANFRALQK